MFTRELSSSDDSDFASDEVGEVSTNLKRLRGQAKMAAEFQSAVPSDTTLAHYANEFPETQSVLYKYIRHCRDAGIPPEGFFLRKKLTGTLDLRHFSLGGRRALALSLAISSLPLLQHVNLSDNRLKDDDIRVLLASLSSPKSTLYSLDLSQNEFGTKATEALCAYLKVTTSLSRLCLSHCSVNTRSCIKLADCIETSCASLTLLDMSHNAIGGSGGVAIGKMLRVCLRFATLSALVYRWGLVCRHVVWKNWTCVGTTLGTLAWTTFAKLYPLTILLCAG